jgi:hypothetical protein
MTRGVAMIAFGNWRATRHVLGAATVAACLVVSVQPARANGGGVLPASARPHGYSLADMARATALFTTSGNDPAQEPRTPFQILHLPAMFVPTFEDGGVVLRGTNTFDVHPGTFLYLPLVSVDDSPTVLGVFPTTPAGARHYFFDPALYGGHDYVATIDGVATPIGPAYLAGPVSTPPLLDGGGTHIITLAAFIHPLSPGTHTVKFTGEVSGTALEPTYGITFLRDDFSYTVNVRSDHGRGQQ